ncbi:MazG nucleotide pyrophosphohydrolase domain-containing protein [Patescibacteria group bacterium]
MTGDFQNKVNKFMTENKIDNPIEYRMLDLVSEMGEVSKEICKMSEYGNSKPKFRPEIKSELGDVFYSLIAVANFYEVDLGEALEIVMEKYQRRVDKGGHAGSDND